MAVAMASVGGMGVIHYNNSLEEQLHQVRRQRRRSQNVECPCSLWQA